jgi:hypothetical protein
MPASVYPLSSTDEVVVYESGLAILRHRTPFNPGGWSVYDQCRRGDSSDIRSPWRRRPKPTALDAFSRAFAKG